MSDYPRKDEQGRTVWACCESTIGPVCKHRASVAPCGAEFYTARDARDHESTCGPCAGAVEALRRELKRAVIYPVSVQDPGDPTGRTWVRAYPKPV